MRFPYRILGNWFDRVFRNNLNDNFKDIEEDLKDTDAKINTKEQESIDRDNQIDGRVSNIITQSGTSDTEVVDARRDSEGINHTTLKDRLDTKDEEFTTQLADVSYKKSLFNDVGTQVRKREAVVSFICDDGKVEDYTIVKPIFDNAGEPYCIALSSQLLNTSGYMTTEQALELQNLGHEMMSHTRNHVHLTQIPLDEAEKEIALSRKELMDMGLKVDSLVYPYGDDSETIRDISRKYYRAGFDITPGMNNPPLLTYKINRVDLAKNNLTELKAYVDQAIAEKSYLVLYFHTYASFDSSEQQELADLIAYCQNQGLPILTANDALDRVGNPIDIKVKDENGVDKFVTMGANGKLNVEKVVLTVNDFAISTTPVTDFEQLKLSITRIQSANPDVSNFPEGSAGELHTNRIGYDRQTFYVYESHNIYDRYWTGSAWSAWEKINTNTEYKILPNGSYLGSSTIADFPKGITVNTISTSDATDMPEAKAGTLITNKIDPNTLAFNHQTYEIYNSYNSYKRYATDTGGWTAWIKTPSEILSKDQSLSVGIVTANSSSKYYLSSAAYKIESTLTSNCSNLPDGIFYQAYVETDGQCTLQVFNYTSSDIDCGTLNFKFKTIQD